MTGAGGAEAAAPGFRVRPAREEDLDTITGFEIDIARVSFGDEAIEDPALHRRRGAGALGKGTAGPRICTARNFGHPHGGERILPRAYLRLVHRSLSG